MRSELIICLGLAVISTVYAQSGESGLNIEVLQAPPPDCARKVKKHDMVVLHYEGYFENGTKFDSSRERVGAVPFQFQLGLGAVIKGWEQGLLDMCPNEKRRLTIPSHLAYGEKGSGEVIPPNANLMFEIELLQVHDGPKPPNVFGMIDIDNDKFLTRDELIMYLSHQAVQQGIPVDLASQQQQKVLHDLFETEDKDKDGKISHEEFTGPKHDEL
ncbi:FK506-binding protein-like [Mytilus californianus]|uniref:FK506-binding protein-like n=1 Tax=Mytilus californianus TaxID=6549 RepID=UPI002247B5A9|nr:FK506-binding protein-like [Mytilus californianus]